MLPGGEDEDPGQGTRTVRAVSKGKGCALIR